MKLKDAARRAKQKAKDIGGHVGTGGIGTGSGGGGIGGRGEHQEGGPNPTYLTGHGRPNKPPGVGEDRTYPAERKTSNAQYAGARAWAKAHPRKGLANALHGSDALDTAANPKRFVATLQRKVDRMDAIHARHASRRATRLANRVR